MPWDGQFSQFTLDYNLEAAFWGGGSSNRPGFIHPAGDGYKHGPGRQKTVFNRVMKWCGSCGSLLG